MTAASDAGESSRTVVRYVPLIICALIAAALEFARWRRLRSLLLGKKTSRLWRTRFPNADPREIRSFLITFVDSFLLPRRARFYLSPDDAIATIYRVIYPSPGSDSLEYETFERALRKKYGPSLTLPFPSNVTLGDVFASIHANRS